MSDTGQRIASLSLEERVAMERRLLAKLGGAAARARISPRPPGESIPLSFAQQRLWFLEQLAPEGAAYNIPRAMRLAGALDEAALRRALDAIVARHEALRTTFRAEAGEPVQVVHQSANIEVRDVDLTVFPAPDRDAELERLFRAEMRRPFDIARDLPLRAVLARLDREDHGLLLVVHHIAADGWSMGIFVKELMALYDAFQKGKPSPLEALPIQYADFARFQRGFLAGPELERQIGYWRQQLAGAPAALDLPTDRPRPAVMGASGARISRALPKALEGALRKLGQEDSATLFMTLLAGFYALLHRYTGADDISVGSPIAGRTRVETEPLIGFFVNTLVLRADLSRAPTFRELERRVKEIALSAFAHQDMPFEKLVEELRPERSTSRPPLFQVMFILQNAPREALALPGLTLRTLEIDPGTTKFDLTLGLHEGKDGLRALLSYSTDLFDAVTMERFLEHYEVLLESAVKAPDAPIAELTIMRPAELREVVTEWNRTSAPGAPFASVAAMVAAAAAQTPEAIAVSLGGERLTYRALEERASRLAEHLRALGVGPDVLVGVSAPRSIEMVVGLYGALKAGGAYLPIDPAYPEERVRVMLDDARPAVLLTLASIAPRLPPHASIVVHLDAPLPSPAAPSPAAGAKVMAENLAYVIYTSGSTGKPKGVAMPHRPLVNLLAWQRESLAAGPKKTLQFASVSFDVSFQEIFSTLGSGGELVLITEEIRRDPAALLALLATEGVERAFLPPVVLQHLAEAAEGDKRTPTALAEIITAGEALVISRSIKRLLSALPGAVIHNHYGPTEAHVVTAARVEGDPEIGPVSIGRPIANTSIFILDPARRPVPIGVPGELYIGGVCLAHGYLNRPELTEERFVPVPEALTGEDLHGGPSRLYRTGDLCRFRADGSIEYLGRIDHQVKIRGYRIELGEIEAVLAQHPCGREAIVLAREDEPGNKRLVAYVARGRQDEGLADALRTFVKERLPEFMVPSAFVLLDRLPLNANGKVDRRALPAPEWTTTAFSAPRTPVEEAIAAIFSELLKAPKVSADAGFFELGGHSLLATRVIARVRDALRVDLPVRSLFEAPTVTGLATLVAEAMLAKAGVPELQGIALGALSPDDRALVERRLLQSLGLAADEARIARRPVEGPVPLSFAQQRLWFLEQMTPGTAVYNIPIGLRVAGLLDVSALREAIDAIVARHAVLRTTYRLVGDEPAQVVLASGAIPFHVVGLDGRPDREREDEGRRILREEARRPFDLTRDAMIRCLVIRHAEGDHAVLITMHHIASDGWSMTIFMRELTELYVAIKAGRPSPLPDLPIQYTDYAAFQRAHLTGEALARELDYWRERLRGAPPFLELPTDHERPAEISYRGAARSITLPRKALEPLRALCREEGATLFMGLLAAYQALLSRYSGQADVCVGVPIAGRGHVETEPLIGFFINTLVLRADVSADPTFRALLAQTREGALAAFAHQDIPFEKLVEEFRPERSKGRAPLVQAAFILQNTPKAPPEAPGLTFTSAPVGTGTTKFDLTLAATETDLGLRLSLAYAADLFEPATIDRMLDAYATLLDAAARAPELAVSALPLLGTAARAWALVAGNPEPVALPAPRCIHAFFAEQAAKMGDAPALSFDGERLSYRALEERSNRLARHLRALGLGPEDKVAVYCERSPAMVVALLAILKAGGGYVPLDPAYPRARNEAILADARARLLVTQDKLASNLPAHGGAEVVHLDGEAARWLDESPAPVVNQVSPDNLAYVIYTSGSTGKPKGVMVTHASVAALFAWARGLYRPEELRAVLFSTSICFDVSVFELFVPLCLGGMIVIAPNALHAPTVAEAGELSLISAVPTAIAELVRMGGIPASVRTVNIAGEILANDLVQDLYARSSVERVYNLYGPTEDTTYSTAALIPRGATTPCPIGLPLPGSHAYVLDARLEPVPPGVAGELYLAGAGLARGYLARPDLTADRFLPDPFSDEPGARMYRTGDRARRRHDGALEVTGRIDFQVKIRGYRIELGEIEAVVARHASVREVVVVAREDAPGDKRLVAYVSSRGAALTAADLREHVKQRLPEFMVPSAFVLLDALPQSPNGKIDRKALPAPDHERAETKRAFVAPRNPIEETIAGIWAEVLRVPSVAADDDFFELGGHSILATRVMTRIREALAVELPLKTVFESPTVAGLAIAVSQQALLELRRARDQKAPASTRAPVAEAAAVAPKAYAIPRRDDGGPSPLSFAQQRLWFLEEMTPGTAVYNIPMGMRAHGALDVDILARALDALLGRHEALRTVFALRDGAPVQIVRERAAVMPRLVDLRRTPPDEREAEAQRVLSEEARRPFDVSRDLLLRATVVRLADDEHLLFFVVHHIASDGWSTGIFFGELAAFYGALREGHAPVLPELPIQYADFAAWQAAQLRGPALHDQVAFWKRQLQGTTPLELPTDRPRPPVQTTRGAMITRRLPKELTRPLRALGRAAGATDFMTLLAAFQALLFRYTGQEDITIGTPIAGRSRAELEPLIGFFVNTLVMRTNLAGAPTFRDLLRRTREAALAAFEHQDVPFEKLVEELRPERVTSRTPLFQVMFVLQNAPRTALTLPGVTLRPLRLSTSTGTAKFDITLLVNEGSDGLRVTAEYNTDLFDAATIQRMLGHLSVMLEGVVKDPDARIDELPILTDHERRAVLGEWNRAHADLPEPSRIHERVAAQARRSPQASAVTFEGERIRYEELDRRSNQIAHLLRRSGVGPDVLVGVCMERSIEMIVALLAVLKAGGAYVPLDPAYPKERLAFMLEDAKVPVLLTEARLTDRLPPHGAKVIRLDADHESVAREPTSRVAPAPSEGPDDLAYVIYTSGSTGKPKGVMVTHRNVTRLFDATERWYRFNERDVWTMFHSFAFDFSVWEIWGALFYGGRVVVVPYLVSRSPEDFYELLVKEGVTVLNQTPSAFRQLIHAEESMSQEARARLALRYVIFGGEALDLRDLRPFWERHGDVTPQLVNMYGITETTVHVTYRPVGMADLARPWSSVIGEAIPDLSVYILDRHRQPVPVGVRGEMYVGGAGVARGYLNRPEFTLERFVPDPFCDASGARLYKTGDVARYLPSGDIEYLGRADHQVKIRGHRIELGEIEAVLAGHAEVREAVVMVREDTPGDKRLVAYLVSARGSAPSAADLRAYLKQTLTDVMIPSAFVAMDALPLTTNGKIDRRALPKPEVDLAGSRATQPPRGPVEARLAGIWEQILGVKNIGRRDNFFELGGHSMLAVKMVAEVEKDFGKKVALALLFENQTLEQLARLLAEPEPEPRRWPTLIAIQPKGSRRPLFCVSTFNVNALGYVALARNLGPDQPVYGLQSRYRPEEGRPYERFEFEQLAREYIAEMKKVQPHGPYYFCGMCEGAHISFEMARILHAEGERIGLLGILDAWPIENTRSYFFTQVDAYRTQIKKRIDKLKKLDGKERVAFVGHQARESLSRLVVRAAAVMGKPAPQGSAAAGARRTEEDFRRRYWPGPDFVPPQVACPIFLFRIRDQPYWRIRDEACGWGSRTSEGVEIHMIAGDHDIILREPHVRVLAEKLNACLLRTGVSEGRAGPSSVRSQAFAPGILP
jgi:amino acid adenylation domain-containing protein